MTKQEVYNLALEYLEQKRIEWKASPDYWYNRVQVVSDTICVRDWFIDFYMQGYSKALEHYPEIYKEYLKQKVDTSIVEAKQTGSQPVVGITHGDLINNIDSLSGFEYAYNE